MASPELLEIYKQLNLGYQAVDDFRAKLLGFLPLASGAAFFGLLNIQGTDPAKMNPYLSQLGLLGSVVTTGLLIYELKGIQKCTGFINEGAAIEKKLLEPEPDKLLPATGSIAPAGKFSALQVRHGKLWWLITEPVASAVIYAAVIAGWVYVATCTELINGVIVRRDNSTPVTCTAIIVFAFVYLFWLSLSYNPIGQRSTSSK